MAKKKKAAKVKAIVVATYGFSYDGKDYEPGDIVKFSREDFARLHKLGNVNPI